MRKRTSKAEFRDRVEPRSRDCKSTVNSDDARHNEIIRVKVTISYNKNVTIKMHRTQFCALLGKKCYSIFVNIHGASSGCICFFPTLYNIPIGQVTLVLSPY